MIRIFKDFLNGINEGLIKTNNPEIILDKIISCLTKMNIVCSATIVNSKIELTVNALNEYNLKQKEIIFDEIFRIVVNLGGYFPSTMKLTNIYNQLKIEKFDIYQFYHNSNQIKDVIISFESKYDSINLNIPDTLYHLSIMEYHLKIMRKGIIPKSNSKLSSHIDRIYLCNTLEDCEELIQKMMFFYSGEKDINIFKKGKKLFNKDITPVIYKINNPLINKDERYINILYIDPNYDNGYYTIQNIKKEYISIKIIY